MATTVQANFNSTDYSTQLVPMCQALFNAEVKITFWGNRVVELSGGQGSISIDELANRMLIAGSKRCSDDDLTLAERLAGVEIVHTLETFYSNSDNLVSQCNFLTRIFLFFREFKMPFTSFGIRFELHCDGEANFRAFSEQRFLRQFGGAFWTDPNERHLAADGHFMFKTMDGQDVRRILAKLDQIEIAHHA